MARQSKYNEGDAVIMWHGGEAKVLDVIPTVCGYRYIVEETWESGETYKSDVTADEIIGLRSVVEAIGVMYSDAEWARITKVY